MGRRVLLGLLAPSIVAAPIAAAKPPQIVVLAVTSSSVTDTPDAASTAHPLVAALEQALGLALEASVTADAAQQPGPVVLVPPQRARQRIKAGEPARCFGDLPCLARLGKRAGGDLVVVGHATVGELGVSIAFKVLEAPSGAVVRHLTFEIRDEEDAGRAIATHFETLLGLPYIKATKPTEATPETRDGRQPAPDDFEGLEVVDLVPLPSAGAAVATAQNGSSGAGASTSAPTIAYAGMAVAGLGVVTLAAGAVSGVLYFSAKGSIDEDGETPQRQARALQKEANRYRDRAYLASAAGSTLTLLGLGMFALDQWLLDDDSAAAVSASPGGVSVRWRF